MAGIAEAVTAIAPAAIGLLSNVATGIFEAIKKSKQPLDIGQQISQAVFSGLESGVPLMAPILAGEMPSMMMSDNDLRNLGLMAPTTLGSRKSLLTKDKGLLRAPAKPKPIPKAIPKTVAVPKPVPTATQEILPASQPAKKAAMPSLGSLKGLQTTKANKQILTELLKYGVLRLTPAMSAKVKGMITKLVSGGKLSAADEKVLKKLRLAHERQT